MGTILGTVKDASGGVVPQAKVTIVNTDTNDTRTATTGDDGSFRFPALVAGHYSVRVEREGFKTQTQTGLTLEVAQEMVVNSTLQVGTSTQEVTVTGEAPMVNTTNSSLGGLVNEAKVADLPLNGRNYTDLSFMQPGVAINANTTSTNTQGGSRGTLFTSDGATLRENMITLDGAYMLNARGGSIASESGTALGVAGVKEYKVVTGAYDASYGIVPGAQVVVVSKGGSTQFHGEAFEYLRNQDMDAANFFDKPVAGNNYERLPLFIRNNFGADAGGPIKKDKTFVYAAYEGLRQRLGLTLIDTVPGAGCHGAANAVITSTACPQLGSGAASVTIAPVMAPILALYPVPNLANNQFTYPAEAPSEVNWGQIRVDQNISASDTLFGRYTTDKSYLTSATTGTLGLSGTGFPEFANSYASYDQSATISENHIFSPAVLNQFRFSYSRNNLFEGNLFPISQYSPNGEASLIGPQYSFETGAPIGSISLSGYTKFGPGSNNPITDKLNTFVLNDDLYYTKGKHALKFGVQVNRWNFGNTNSATNLGSPTFTSLANFLAGIDSNYVAPQGAQNAVHSRNWWWLVPGLYAQDDWRVSQRLTLNLGLRYEFVTDPTETNNRNSVLVNRLTDSTFTQGKLFAPFSKDHFSPRVGFAWDVQGNGKTSVRGGFGQYYDIGNWAGALQGNYQANPPLNGLLTHINSTNAVMPLPFTFLPTDQLGATTMNYNLLNPYLLKWNLTVERQLPLGIGLQVAYVGTRGVHLYQLFEGNQNLPTAVVNGLPYWNGTEPRQNPNFSSLQDEASLASSTYNALQVALNKRFSHGIQFQMSYTYSHALDNMASSSSADCSAASGMEDGDYFGPGNSVFMKGPSCSDVTHNVRVNILYHIPNIKSDNFAAKLEHGWWAGIIWSAQTGYPFTPVLGNNRSQSQIFKTNGDYPNIATAADAAACPAVTSTCKYVPVPFNPSTVITGNPAQWYNPDMFTLEPMFTAPGSGVICGTAGTSCGTGTTYGTLGNVSKGLLRGPGLDNVDFSINKDTRLPFLGEQGMLEFRAEIFNIMNDPSFNMPNGTVISGSTSAYGPYSQAPSSSAGVISSTTGPSRQIQLALKIVF
jgi:outer membrane receptor protein involved in Fe transport